MRLYGRAFRERGVPACHPCVARERLRVSCVKTNAVTQPGKQCESGSKSGTDLN